MTRLIGVPSVCPSNTPDRICTVSDSLRCDTSALCPGARRSRSGWMSPSDRGSRGGQPSTTAPVAPPCDSPQVVTRKRRPQLLPMRRGYVSRRSNSKQSGFTTFARSLASRGRRARGTSSGSLTEPMALPGARFPPVLRQDALDIRDATLRGHPLLGVEAVLVEGLLGVVDHQGALQRRHQ